MSKLNLSEYAVNHRTLIIFMLILLLVAGVGTFTKLGRSEDPFFNVPSMIISVNWRGATAEEVQNQVLDTMEQELQELQHFDYVSTYARQGYGAITLWAIDGTPKRILEHSWYQARKKILDIRSQLPSNIEGPFFNDEYADVYSVVYSLGSDTLNYAELLDLAEKIKVDLQTTPGVNKIDFYGQQPEKIYVDISAKKMAALGLTPQQIASSLSAANNVTPSGSIDNSSDRLFIRLNNYLKTVDDVKNVTLHSKGKLLKLSNFAEVTSGYEEPRTYVIHYNGKPVIVIAISSRENTNTLSLGAALDKKFQWWRKNLPPSVYLEQTTNQPKVVEESIAEFEGSFIEALAIVLSVSFLSLGWRTGWVIAASVPLVLAVVSIVMFFADWTLNRVTLGALIIALGLLVDDAIISTEAMLVKIEEGWSKLKAATYSYTATAFPMLTGTLVTIAGFLPVGFAQSGAGEYTRGIFWIVSVALIASWFVAVIFTPVVGITVLKASPHAQYKEPEAKKPTRFSRFIQAVLIKRKLVLVSTVLLLVLSAAGMLLVKQQFFPTTPRLELLIDLKMREGSSIDATEAEVKRIEKFLDKQNGIKFYNSFIGAGAPRFFISLAPELPNPGYAQIVIMTKSIEDRDELRMSLKNLFATNPAYANVNARVTRLDFGPPVGFPVQFRVIGQNAKILREIAYQVLEKVKESPLVRNTQLNWNEQVRVYKVNIDQDKANKVGLTNIEIATTINTIVQGIPATVLRRDDELIDVIIRGSQDERKLAEKLDDIALFTADGKSLPLSQIATIETGFEEPVLWRRNRELTITVRTDLKDGVEGPDATAQIWPTLQDIIKSLPEGYRIEQGGIKEENDKANQALMVVFPSMVFAILIILIIQLQSLSLMSLVLLSAPLGLIGVVPALLIFNKPFGFVALLGLIALSGMIMRNTVILVVQIEQNIKAGIAPWNAIIDATLHRARPVFLTALSAILGMIPLSISLFWGPMAIAIMGGLLVATALTLVFVPALYAVWFGIKQA